MNYILTGSGHGSGTVFNANVQREKKCLEIGVILKNSEGKIAGADIKYKVFTGKYDETEYRTRFLRPFFQYNLIYHTATVSSPDVIKTENTDVTIPAEKGTIATIEHYISYGLQMRFYKNFYFESSLGMGVYFGSLDKENHPNTIGIHGVNHGFTGSFKFGIGYRLN